jgi:ATP-dependent DNA ligase
MLALEVSKPFSDDNWIFEIKWDGFRGIAYVNETFSLRSRNGKELKATFPELQELTYLARNVVVDGEIVITKNGKVDFQALQKRSQVLPSTEVARRASSTPATYIVFDIWKRMASLWLIAVNRAKEILSKSVKEEITFCFQDFIEGRGEDYYRLALPWGLEGIVAKKKSSI